MMFGLMQRSMIKRFLISGMNSSPILSHNVGSTLYETMIGYFARKLTYCNWLVGSGTVDGIILRRLIFISVA
jgi:hypothetical protein